MLHNDFNLLFIFVFYVGWTVSEEELKDAAIHSGVLEVSADFLEPEFRAECERVLPYPDKVVPSECRDTFLYLKEKCNFE